MAHLYDLMLLLDVGADDERRHDILADVREMVDEGGALVEAHDWGARRMAYEMRHRPEAEYQLIRFEGENDLLDRLNGTLRIMDGVMRYRIIRQKPGGPAIPPPPEPVRAGQREDEPEGRVAARAAADASPDAADDEPAPDEE